MRHTQRTTIVLGHVLAAALIALTACGGGDAETEGSGSDGESASEEPSADAAETPEPDLEGIPEVVAEVNGEQVTRDDFVTAYEAQFQQASMQAQMGGPPPDEEALRQQTADGLVDAELLRQEADDRGISATEQDVEDTLTELATQNQLGSAQEFLDAIAEQGTPEDEVRSQVETQVLVEGLVTDEAGAIEPTEQELRELYDQTKQQQAQGAQQGGQQQPIPPFGQVRPQLEQQAVAQEQGRVAQRLVGQLREDADVTVNL